MDAWQEDQIQELYMVRRTVCEMLVDRGYLLPSDSCAEEGLTLDQVFLAVNHRHYLSPITAQNC